MKWMCNVKGNQFHVKKLNQTLVEMLHQLLFLFLYGSKSLF